MITAPLLAKGREGQSAASQGAQPLNQKDADHRHDRRQGRKDLARLPDVTTIEALVDGLRTLMGDDLTRRRSCARPTTTRSNGDVVKVMDRLASNGHPYRIKTPIPAAGRRRGIGSGAGFRRAGRDAPSPAPAPARRSRAAHLRGGREMTE